MAGIAGELRAREVENVSEKIDKKHVRRHRRIMLFAIHSGVNALDVLGPLEVLTSALHNSSDPCNYTVFLLQIFFILSPSSKG